MGVRWKVCGITNPGDAQAAADAGADALGFILWPPSRRSVSVASAAAAASAAPASVWRVGVFVNPSRSEIDAAVEAVGLDFIQLSGDEQPGDCRDLPRPVWKAIRLEPGFGIAEARQRVARYEECRVLIDAGDSGRYGGTGETVDWSVAAQLASERSLVLAGGLRAENVAAAIEQVKPWGVDVASGVEASAGRKDHRKLRRFAAALEPYR